MLLLATELEGAFIIEFAPIADERGSFMRFYDRGFFAANDLQTTWEQESVSFNRKAGTVRGLHFQLPPFAETKIVRVSQGAIRDVFVDLRRDSPTFGKWRSVELSAANNRAVYIPKGFAHGFCTLAENTAVEYKIDIVYRADFAGGIRWNDEDLAIDWNIENPIISERDAALPLFAELNSPF